MNTKHRNLAIITGASSGIGLEFAFLCAERTNFDIILVARRIDRLHALRESLLAKYPDKIIHCIGCDLSKKEDRNKMWATILSYNAPIGILINNAGFGSYGYFKDKDLDKELEMIELNCASIVDLCHKALALMIPQNNGAIINVSSMASFQGVPFLATYSSTKAFVTSFSLALSEEVQKYGIKVQALCPGPVATEFGKVAGFPDKISITSSLSAKEVAICSFNALEKSQTISIPGISNFLLAQLNRLVPRVFASKLTRIILEQKRTI